MTTTDKRVQATSQVLDHVERAREALKESQVGTRVQGVLASLHVRAASLKWAHEELRKVRNAHCLPIDISLCRN